MIRFSVLLAVLAPCARAAAPDPELALILRGQEAKRAVIEKLVVELGVRPGMTVLDIGAGTGQHAYRLAETVKEGGGRVYATDIDPRMTAYVAEQARRRGLDNLSAVLVSPSGLDPFYSKHRYDLALVSDVYNFLEDRVTYFGRLRDTLAPGGRVAVVSYPDRTHGFAREDFSDWEGFLADLRAEPRDAPFGRRLAAPAAAALAGLPAGDVCGREAAVMRALDELVEGDFFTAYAAGGIIRPEAGLPPEEEAYARVRISRLELTGFPARKSPSQLSISDRHMLAYVNKLLVIARYRARLFSGGARPYLSEGLESRWHREADMLSREMRQAGYRLERRFDLVPFQAVWVFARSSETWTPPIAAPRPAADERALAVRAQEAKAPHAPRLLEALAAAPGQRVLDLGAGTGQMSYRLASALGGTLRVDAADIDPVLTAYVSAQASARGLKNLESFTVSADGAEGFPEGRLYDRFLLYDVFSYLRDRPAYFARLRRRAAPGALLVVAAYAGLRHDFERGDLLDPAGLAAALASRPPRSSLGRIVGQPLSRSLDALPAGDACRRERATLFHLNRALDSELFASYAKDGELDASLAFTPEERDMARLLHRRAELAGVPGRRPLSAVDGVEGHMIALLNRMILAAELKPLLRGGRAADDADAVTAAVEAGGWRLRGRSAFNPFQDLWVFEAGPRP